VLIRLGNLGIDFLFNILHLREGGIENVPGLRSDRAEDFSNLVWGEPESLLGVVVDFRDGRQSLEDGGCGAGLNCHMLEFVDLLVGYNEGRAESS